MGYIGSGVQRFNTADGLTVTGSAEINSLTYPTADGEQRSGAKDQRLRHSVVWHYKHRLGKRYQPSAWRQPWTLNGNNIEFPDSSGAEVNRLKFGAGDDLQHLPRWQ